ncbi:unnamed protein product [Polarella glacialis]|uniref:Uncharacterized protein n=1 Tax=Polarella glacialis TaxID=89957 RepID=A0A813FYF5_POLGL|nr:unnamed protein product [Polarella glacialis]
MNKQTLCLLGPQEEGCEAALAQTARLGNSANKVLWREKDTYVVRCDDMEAEQKTLDFTFKELEGLDSFLEEKQGKLVVGMLRRSYAALKTVTLVYRNSEEAQDDVEIIKTPQGWQVRQVAADGTAKKVGVCGGQQLLKFTHALPNSFHKTLLTDKAFDIDNLPCRWQEIYLEEGKPPWHTQAHGERTLQPPASEDLWYPCKLVFDVLIPGSEALSAIPGGDGPHSESMLKPRDLTLEYLLELRELGHGAKITFQHFPQERINRADLRIRHCHVLELEEHAHSSTQNDADLCSTWLMSSSITPAHLGFVFKKLVAFVRKEMHSFESGKKDKFEILLAKSLRCVEINNLLETGGRSKTLADDIHHTTWLDEELSVRKAEIYALLDSSPLYFVRELDTTTNSHSRPPISLRHKSAETRQQTQQMSQPVTSSLARQPQSGNSAASAARVASKAVTGAFCAHADNPDIDAAITFLKEQAVLYLSSLRDRDDRSTTTTVLSSSEDGRISPKEFERLMIMCGVTWLTAAQTRALFDSMDTDNSGKLNIAELLSCANRVMQLTQRADDFWEEKKKAGIPLKIGEVLGEFWQTLQLGTDLVGTKRRPLVLDSHITASSYFKDQAESGRGQMWQSRLDSEEAAWIGKPRDQDPEPWLQWDFAGVRQVTAIVTRGRPDADQWVESYKISFTKLCRRVGDDEQEEEWQEYAGGQEFHGNSDRHTKYEHLLNPPIQAARVRLHPTYWHGRCPSLRATLYSSSSVTSSRNLNVK